MSIVGMGMIGNPFRDSNYKDEGTCQMHKKRLFYLDFIRAVAVVLILLTHYNVPWLPVPARSSNVITTSIGGIYIGDFGVSLFLAISGAALMYVYGEKCDIKTFFLKRFKTIYPMFWIAFVLVFLFRFLETPVISPTIPRSHILYSLFGMDMLALSAGIPTFATVGEWFLGLIILLYICFPLLRWLLLRFPICTAAGSLAVYVFLLLFYRGSIPESCFILFRIPEFLLGMYFTRYIKKVPLLLGAASLAVVVSNSYLHFLTNSTLATTIIGSCAFLVLAFLARFLDFLPIRTVCFSLSKYSYPIFLLHHVIFTEVLRHIDLPGLTRTGNYTLFIACVIIVMAASVGLYYLNKQVLAYFRKMFIRDAAV